MNETKISLVMASVTETMEAQLHYQHQTHSAVNILTVLKHTNRDSKNKENVRNCDFCDEQTNVENFIKMFGEVNNAYSS